jgi:hypothetical protein
MTKPPKRPRGRPKQPPSAIFTVRVPQPLAAAVKAYAALHTETISTLVRAGLRWRIDEGCPYRQLARERDALLAALGAEALPWAEAEQER